MVHRRVGTIAYTRRASPRTDCFTPLMPICSDDWPCSRRPGRTVADLPATLRGSTPFGQFYTSLLNSPYTTVPSALNMPNSTERPDAARRRTELTETPILSITVVTCPLEWVNITALRHRCGLIMFSGHVYTVICRITAPALGLLVFHTVYTTSVVYR